jgi:hypothetical protein
MFTCASFADLIFWSLSVLCRTLGYDRRHSRDGELSISVRQRRPGAVMQQRGDD